MVGIYKITNPKGRIYIGQSINIEKRKKKYMTESCTSQIRLYTSLKKYGFTFHTFEVIEECEEEELNERERYWQEYYDVLSSRGLNCLLTSTNTSSGKRSRETVKKMSSSTLGIPKGSQRIVKCPVCKKEGGISNMHRYHFENCKKDHSTGPAKKVRCTVCGKEGGISIMKQYHFENCGKKVTKPQEKVKCPHCGVEGGSVVMQRHHFTNCKKVTKKVGSY